MLIKIECFPATIRLRRFKKPQTVKCPPVWLKKARLSSLCFEESRHKLRRAVSETEANGLLLPHPPYRMSQACLFPHGTSVSSAWQAWRAGAYFILGRNTLPSTHRKKSLAALPNGEMLQIFLLSVYPCRVAKLNINRECRTHYCNPVAQAHLWGLSDKWRRQEIL